MPLDRRTLLTGLAGAAALTPLGSHAGSPREQTTGPSGDRREQLTKLFGDKLMGNEQIAMLLYPGMTALDLVGPYHFLGSMPGAKLPLVTNQLEPDRAYR